MKKIYFIALLAIMLSGCNDLLIEDDRANGEAASDQFYSTSKGYETLINVCYSTLKDIWGNEPFLFSAGTDLYETGKSPAPAGISTYLSLGSTEQCVSDFYQRCYSGIQKCNIALYYGERTEETSDLPQLKAEAAFIRALYYFQLVQQFGGVPIVEEMISSPVLSFERKSAAEVYTFIISQMEGLLGSLPEKSTGADFGRVDKRTVNHFLSKVYLTRGWETGIGSPQDFDKAISYGKAAIGTDGLTLPFKDVFKFGNEKNAEIIFSVQYDPVSMVNTKTDGNMQSAMFGTAVDPPTKGKNPTKNSYLIPSRHLFEIFQQDDERYDATFLSMIHTYVLDYYFYTPAELATRNISFYYPPHWATTDADILAWRAIDPAHRTNTTVKKFDNMMFTDVQNFARPMVRKFDDPTAEVSGARVSSRDVFLARLAETYLNVAEAYLKKDGNGTNALAYVNAVRARAKTSLVNAADITIDFILDERAREMAGEYCRWNDLKRTGKLKEYASLYNSNIKSLIDLGTDPFKGTGGFDKILRPIPSSALDANKADIQQNPGY